ncbi:PAS domain S-box protein [Mucilaginibacter boryungensis]|uniref:histidine kinase n=1 Tax=Mucilaginibacter boryungensis TaxID=768480 RepID=A0ABR9XEZ7_9SPHI|nr:PAS domain S-box protein [Mucilaginibacter boryungensis]MBE9665650.1 PAS domain S-box protein [Mucilaginibacter boryungensis]
MFIKGTYLLIRQELSVNQLMLAGFALLLVFAAAFLLYKKLNRLHEEALYDNTEEPDTDLKQQPVIKFTATAPSPEPDLDLETLAVKQTPVTTTPPPSLPAEMLSRETYQSADMLAERTNTNALLNSLSDIIFEYDENKVCINLWYNKSQNIIADVETYRGKAITETMVPANAKVINEAFDFVAANRKSTIIEFQLPLGSGKWLQAHISPVLDERGNFTRRTTLLVTDISEKKKQSLILKEKQQLLLNAQKLACMGSWMYDLRSKQTTWSDNLYNLLGITALPKGTSHFEYYVSQVQAEDRRSVYQFFSDIAGINHHDNHHRILTSNGNSRYFRIVRGEPIRDEKGNIVKVTGIIQDITESRTIERSIKKSQAELLEAQTIAKIGNWKWYLGRPTISWSDEVFHIFEVDPKSIETNNSHFRLLLKYVHPDDKAILIGFLKNPVNMRRTSYEYRIITPKGKIKYLNLIITKIIEDENGKPRSVIGTLQDISDRKLAELNIRQTEDNYKLVLETIKLAALSLDKNGNIIFCNKYLANLLGYHQDQLIGLNWYDRFVPSDLKNVFKSWYQDRHIKSSYVNPVICRNGDQRVISWQNTIIYDEAGHVKQTTSIGEDVTDQQKDRQKLITAKEEAEKASSFKSDFLSTMSHEIRTPMNAVIGTTNLLLEENPRPDQLVYLNNLKFSGENLLGIIDDILDYNKIEAGKLELNKAPLNIRDLANNIRQSFQAKAMEKKLEIIVEVDELIPKQLIGDPIRISQILNNLLSNAIKFTHKGNITVLIREETRDSKRIKLNFTVADTGIGIDPKNLEKMFEPFVQETQRQNYGGTGLGLAIIKRLVELHGSQINASSILGKGTQFNFTIEFEYTAAPISAPALNPAQKMQEGNLAGMRVLVVDDNKMNILIASRFLNRWNVTITEANNGLVATELAADNDYDLIIMDLQMPVMDGFEATKVIKQKRPKLPIIALTADAMPETFAKARNCGMDDYLTKPFMPEILFEKVSKHYKAMLN